MRAKTVQESQMLQAPGGMFATARIWLSQHPQIINIAVTTIATVPFAVVIALDDSPWRWLTVGALIAAGVMSLWRRQIPITAVVVIALLAAISEPRPFTLILAVSVYSVAVRRQMSQAILGYLIGVGVPLIGTGVKILLALHPGAPEGQTPPVGIGTSIFDPYIFIGLAVGIVVQNVQQRRHAQADLLEQRLTHARALERALITAEMHDVVGHALTVMIALANGARAGSRTDPVRSSEALEHLARVGSTAMDDMQRTLRLLRDSDMELDDALHRSGHDLPPLEDTIEVFRAAGLPVTLAHSGAPIPDDVLLVTTIHRIVQEGLANALRYATGATRVDVTITHNHNHNHDLITIDITDDGNAEPARSLGTGRGLIGIAERAAAFGGTTSSGPRAPRGWETRAILRLEHRS